MTAGLDPHQRTRVEVEAENRRKARASGLLVVVHPELPPAWLNSPIALRPQDVPEGPWRDRVRGRA